MDLAKGMRIRLSGLRPESISARDWMNDREPQIGDVATIEDVTLTDKGKIFRLLCESAPGYLGWRVDINEGGFDHHPVK